MHVTASLSLSGPPFVNCGEINSCLSGYLRCCQSHAYQDSRSYDSKSVGASVFLSVFLQCLVKPNNLVCHKKGCVIKNR